MQFNLWGWMGFRGSNRIADLAADLIRDRMPDVITLNEVCLNQAEVIGERLSDWNLGYQWLHDPITVVGGNDSPCVFGNALFWLGDSPAIREPSIGLEVSEGRQARKMLVVKLHLDVPTVLAVTHLSSGRGEDLMASRRSQALQVASLIDVWVAQGFEVIIGGDFNVQPDSPVLDPIYLPAYGKGAHGRCNEATGTEAAIKGCRRRPFVPTFRTGKKFDYVFATPGYEPAGSEAVASASDHHAYFGFFN